MYKQTCLWKKRLKILSCGAGQQSSALALMSAENAIALKAGEKLPWPLVPIYDVAVFCDLSCEPSWVYEQVKFISDVYKSCGLNFVVLTSDLYGDHIQRVQNGKYIKMPLWTLQDGKKGKLHRTCTVDYKIIAIHQYVKYHLLGYRWRERIRDEDVDAHEMHIGFSVEERQRIFESKNPMFVNKYPLADMGLTRKDNYTYCLEKWGIETKGSSCYICPFHKNYFFKYLQKNYPVDYEAAVHFDNILCNKPKDGAVKSELFITGGLQRIWTLSDGDCNDAQTFSYMGNQVWNGF